MSVCELKYLVMPWGPHSFALGLPLEKGFLTGLQDCRDVASTGVVVGTELGAMLGPWAAGLWPGCIWDICQHFCGLHITGEWAL